MTFESEVVQREVYRFPTPATIAVETENQSFSRPNISRKLIAELILEKTKNTIGDGTARITVYNWSAQILIAAREYIEAFEQGEYFPTELRPNGEVDLSSNCSEYSIRLKFPNAVQTQENFAICYQDYGYIRSCKGAYGCQLYLDLPDSRRESEQEVRQKLARLFRCPAIEQGGNTNV